MKNRKKIMAGVFGALIVLTCGSLVLTLTSLMSAAICEERGFEASAFSIVFSALSAGAIIINFSIGKLIEKFGMKKLAVISAVAPAIVLVSMGLVNNIYLLYVIAFIGGVMYTCSYVASYNIYVSSWFDKGKGILITLSTAVPATVVMVISPLFASMIRSSGIKMTCVVFGIGVSVISLIASLFICELPKNAEDTKISFGKEKEKASAAAAGAGSDQSSKQKEEICIPASHLVRHPIGILALLCPFFVAFAGNMYVTYAPYILQSFGLEYVQASYYFSVCSIGNLILSLLVGILADRFGARTIVLIYSLAGGIGLAVAALISGQAGAILFVLFYGCSTCFAIIPGFLFPQLFGQKNSMSFFGWGNMTLGITGIFAAPVAMAVYNAAGQSYKAILYLCGVLFVCSFLLNAYMMSSKSEETVRRLNKKYMQEHPEQ